MRYSHGTHLDVGSPAVVIGLPLHPPLENLPRACHVPEHLLHVNVLVPASCSFRSTPAGLTPADRLSADQAQNTKQSTDVIL